MSAQEELEKLEREIRTSLSTYVIPLGAWADRLAAIREGLGKAQEPVAWLWHYADGKTKSLRWRSDQQDWNNGDVPARSEPLYLATPADPAPSLEGIRVSLCAPTASEPFRRLECSVVDIGHSDRCLVVECKELEKEQADSAQVLVDALERIACYPRGRHDEIGYTGCRTVAREALATHKHEVKG